MNVVSKGLGLLRAVLEKACVEEQCSRDSLTVLSKNNDPYRVDTPSGHRDGAWLAEQIERALGPYRRIHLRGLHYLLVSQGNVRKPNGEIYVNSDADDAWLALVLKAGRWLQYIPFERISDNRNAEPIIWRSNEPIGQIYKSLEASAFVSWGEIATASVYFREPEPSLSNFKRAQPYAITIFGEKSSLENVLAPIAQRCSADLYLGAGEISDTLMYQMAKDAAADGRPMVVICCCDFDPAGRQMPVSIGRKLQAFRDLFFPGLQFEVVPTALTVEQVRELGLPSTPLKETEKRASRWREEFGVEQTEIDALATLRPDVLRRIVEQALEPYFDSSLDRGIRRARE